MAFVHLHSHSDFSILDGASHVPDMVGKSYESLVHAAFAPTDHGYLFGIQILTLHAVRVMGGKTLASGVMMWNVLKGFGIQKEPPTDDPNAGEHDRVHVLSRL